MTGGRSRHSTTRTCFTPSLRSSLERIGSDGARVVQGSQPIGTGRSRSLRWENAGPTAVDDETIRVRSQSCTNDCGPEDVYRLRLYETTCVAPRFNNSATQVTVVQVHNSTAVPVSGTFWFWSASGVLLASEPISLDAYGSTSVNTSTLPGLAGQSGSLTLSSDAPYGGLGGKAVALEPGTGMSFESPLEPRPR